MQNLAMPESALWRILDANLDRAREGLRVIEEWCRFGREDQGLTQTCKELRQTLGARHLPHYRQARNTATDPGTTLTHSQETERSDLRDVLQVNLSRIQESLRVLEEYGKLADPGLAQVAKESRYQVYILESQLLPQAKLDKLKQTPLYLVTSPHENLITIVKAALEGGLQLVQYRDKTSDDQTRLHLAQALKTLCQQYNALFILNDRVDLALGVDADGVHLGQQDIPIKLARRILGPDKIVGRSTTNPQEMERAIAEGADYIGVGPIYTTPTKPGKAAVGFDYIHYAQAQAPLPWFAIGGIDETNIGQVVQAGAKQVAVVRAIMAAADPQATTQKLLQTLCPHPNSTHSLHR
ncbi:thiamine phosphate synthase [Thermosynechococcaceae cyanobacterium BACA0444]|uniref:Thiamine-phosphate synthase n=1 Tax=Pseudocalidococcus azoricus BACA0444 TaxID=2918990 RepID=A0AAE4JZM9_9CYAN|nr:thiamine phosphate synthase [Pseudocalidococcus azoricus]MDS3861012.1 thiamine phosphate synthase [Pseudocalidococcus azoricus BACA0444]